MATINFKDHFQRKLLLTASLGLLLACTCVALASVLPLQKQMKAQQANHLIFAVKTRSMVVDEFLAKATETALQITSRTQIRESLEKYNNKIIDLAALQHFSTPKLQDALNLSQFAAGISRLDQQGKPVVEIGLPAPEIFRHLPDPAMTTPTIRGPVTIADKDYIVVSAPILGRDGALAGLDIVLFTASKLLEITQDYTGLGTTGETILATFPQTGPAHLFFPTRSSTRADRIALMFPYFSRATTAPSETFGTDGTGAILLHETPDELAAYGPIAGMDWGIIVIMNKDELFGPITRQVLLIALVSNFINTMTYYFAF